MCPWRLDGLRAEQPGLDSRQGQYVSIHKETIYDYAPVLSDYMCMLCRSQAVVVFTYLRRLQLCVRNDAI
jgi:hypothetical protein